MNKILNFSIIILGLGLSLHTSAQRIAYIDTEYILESMPEYQDAQKELDALSEQWQKTIEAKYEELSGLKKSYKAEEILLTPSMKKQRLAEIDGKEKEALDYQRQKFGIEGELFKKRKEIVKPIQDKIFEAVKEIADRNNYSMVLDKSGQSNILFADPKYDKSEEVLRKIQ